MLRLAIAGSAGWMLSTRGLAQRAPGRRILIVGGGFAGSITAALFLNRFVTAAKTWAHFDIYGWTQTPKSARPDGGECQAARALYALLKERYGSQ